MDLSRAFDTINHSTLIPKLMSYGINDKEILWFCGYLFHIFQTVDYNGKKSSKVSVTYWSISRVHFGSLVICFSTVKRLSTVNNFNVFYCFNIIIQVSSYLYLGNTIDCSSNLNKNVDNKYKKASGKILFKSSSSFWSINFFFFFFFYGIEHLLIKHKNCSHLAPWL